ncbi:XrtA/PEP-CTERM system histidine kinase PrsK [uncultured Sphingomonas sp.]|uniref:XrtA/PEP-CTERM system histidine kinase PrsK n=1 Tax=uncultured Sphingomonas sp. TaxID=158754 RepID=UPI0035CC57EB
MGAIMSWTVPGSLLLWCWALAALLLGIVGVDQWRQAGGNRVRRVFAGAVLGNALWALAMAGIDGTDLVTRLAEGARTLAWLGFMAMLARQSEPTDDGRVRARATSMADARPSRNGSLAIGAIYGVVALIVLAGMGLAVLATIFPDPAIGATLRDGRLILRMMAAVSALVLTHQLHAATRGGAQHALRLVIGILGAVWLSDLVDFMLAYMLGGWTPMLVGARAIATLSLAPALAVAAHRDGDWSLRVSRTVAWQSLRAVGVVGYLAITLLGTALIERWGGAQARLWQTAFVIGTGAATLTLIANPWLRAWTRVKIAKHLFSHRYDYRAEWVRFTDTLGRGQDGQGGGAPLDRRIVQAVADLTASPAGLLLVSEGAETGGGLGVGAGWNWPAAQPGGAPLARHLAATARIVELDAVRAGTADPEDAAAVPGWMLAHEEAWAIVPLIHFGALTGAILLARPPIDRALDWEDLDLLRIAGRQVASYIAEARARDALAEAQRFDEFSRRFAFIVHDIKNLVSQLSLVARNAERHADNPAFRADMVATLRDSADRMNALLARLSQHHHARAEPPRATDLRTLAERIARRRRMQHPVIVAEGGSVLALADEARLEQLLDHLVQNAIEASAPGAAVTLEVWAGPHDGRAGATIAVVDTGCGMTPGFVRDELFRAFHSSKPGGFGIGAFEARQLAEAMGGSVAVESREGEGTRFAVRLPSAPAAPAEMGRAA